MGFFTMDVHRYNSRTGYIDKTVNLSADNAKAEFNKVIHNMKYDAFCTHYRVTLFDSMRRAIVADSDNL